MPVNFVNNCSFAFKMANTCTYVLQGFQGLLDKVHPIIKVKCAIRLYFRQFSKNFTILGEKREHFASSERS
jgi:hypothetical protein